MDFTLSNLRISNGAFFRLAFRSFTSSTFVTIAYMFFRLSGTVTMAPIGTSVEVKYISSSANFDRERGITVMIFML